jgi:hypothetical protein
MVISKKAQAHIEAIFSFSLFIGFLIFVLFFLNPFTKTQSENSQIDQIKNIVIKNISSDIGKVSIILNNLGSCYNLTSLIGQYGNKFVVINETNRKYTVYFSDKFNDNSDTLCITNDFSYGVYSKESFIVYESAVNLKGEYNSDYQTLKQKLGIINDFSFRIKDMENNTLINAERNIPKSIDVKSEDTYIRIINSSGSIFNGVINIKIW